MHKNKIDNIDEYMEYLQMEAPTNIPKEILIKKAKEKVRKKLAQKAALKSGKKKVQPSELAKRIHQNMKNKNYYEYNLLDD
jgi:hypothetical protein